MSRRVQYLDELGSRGTHTGFYAPEAVHHPLPTYPDDPQAAARQRASDRRPNAGSADLVEAPDGIRLRPTARGIPVRHRQGQSETPSNPCPAGRHWQGIRSAEDLPELPAGQGLLHSAVPWRVQRLHRGRRHHRPAERDEPWDMPSQRPETEWEPQA